MNALDPRDQDFIAAIRRGWSPGPIEPAAFAAGLTRRFRRERRRRALLGAGLAAALLAFGAWQLAGDAPAPAPAPQLAAAPAEPSPYWSEALDPAARTYALPGEYQALNAFFLQPATQEL